MFAVACCNALYQRALGVVLRFNTPSQLDIPLELQLPHKTPGFGNLAFTVGTQ